MDLLAWYNLIFVAPIGLAGVYLALSATGLGDLSGEADFDADVDLDGDMDLDMDADADFDVDMDADADIDFDADADVDMDHDLEFEGDTDVEVEGDLDHDVESGPNLGAEHEVHEMPTSHQASLLLRALSVLGFGKVPVSILMTCLMVIFGATGLITNGLFENVLPWEWAPNLYVWPSLALATTASLGLTGTLARALSRLMPTKESYAITEEELEGQVGVSVYGMREDGRGPVNVRDPGGTLHQVMGRTLDGALPKGTEVLLVRYHRKGDYYDVATSPLSAIAEGVGESVSTHETAPDRPDRNAVAEDDEARRQARARAADEETSSSTND